MKGKIKNLFDGFVMSAKIEKTIILFICMVIIMYLPVWGGYLFYYLFHWNWCFALASSYLTFWAGPFTPYFPLCLTITFAIKRLIEK